MTSFGSHVLRTELKIFLNYLLSVTAEDYTANVQRIVSSLRPNICRAVTKGQQRTFILFAFSIASSLPEIVLWKMCKFGFFLVVMWQSGSSSWVISRVYIPVRGMDGKTSWVPPWYSPSLSCSVMPWAVWTETCLSSAFNNCSRLSNSEWNTDDAAGFTSIWEDRRFEDSCNALATAAGFTTIWVDRRVEDSWMLLQWPQGL